MPDEHRSSANLDDIRTGQGKHPHLPGLWAWGVGPRRRKSLAARSVMSGSVPNLSPCANYSTSIVVPTRWYRTGQVDANQSWPLPIYIRDSQILCMVNLHSPSTSDLIHCTEPFQENISSLPD